MQAVFSGVLEGLKESDEDGDSHLKGAFYHLARHLEACLMLVCLYQRII